MKRILPLLPLILFCTNVFSQAPGIEWQKCYGSTYNDWGNSMAATSDHGYILAGETDTSSAQVTGNHGGSDFWLVKTDSLGTLIWEKSLGGSGSDVPYSVQQTRDGGYIVAGLSNSTNGNVTGNHGGNDFWVVRLDNLGNIEWEKSFGGSGNDAAQGIEQTRDGGYIVAGTSSSTDGQVTGNHGGSDMWVVKLDSIGNMMWEKSYGGSANDGAGPVQQTNDGGYIFGGASSSIDGDVTGNHGSSDYWVVKTDSLGNLVWENSYGGSGDESLQSLRETNDGGYILAGYDKSNDGDIRIHYGYLFDEDFWVVKLNANGNIEWQKTLGGSAQDIAADIRQTFDGGYIVAGQSNSADYDVLTPLRYGFYEDWIVKLTAYGSIEWQKSLGGSGGSPSDFDQAQAIVQNYDSSFAFISFTNSNDGEVSGNHGGFDYSVFKITKSPPPCMVFSFTNTNFSCTRFADTSIVTVTTGTADSINWGDGIAYNLSIPLYNHFYTQPGIYTITIVNDTGCYKTLSDTVVNLGVTIDTTLFINPTCNNAVLGAITIDASGGSAPYSYHWTTGATTAAINNLTGGDYSVSVNDNTGCLSVMHYNLYQLNASPAYFVYFDVTNPNCANNGQLKALAHGGIPPYAYNWSTLSTAQTVTNAGEGNYAITVTDSVGCEVTASTFVNPYCQNFIYGILFNDLNNNCIVDSGEPRVRNVSMTATDANGTSFYGWANNSGQYYIAVPDTGAYIVTAGIGYFGNCTSSRLCFSNPVTFHGIGDTSFNNNFALTFSGFDLTLGPGCAIIPPCYTHGFWAKWYFLNAYNNSPVPVNGPATVTFHYDSVLSPYGQIGSPGYTTLDRATHTITWVLDTVPLYGDPLYLSTVEFNFLTYDASYQLHSDFRITPYAGDCDTGNNHFSFVDPIFDSNDPNSKTVSPGGNITNDDSVLTYTISFQNTGNDTAWVITVVDTLSSNLQPGSVRTIASSIPVTDFKLSGTGILTWVFNPAYLPDSVVSPVGSKGFVMFQVKKKSNLPMGATISNKASIYFDSNAPVVTNTVADTLANPLYILPVINNNGVSVTAFPNPFGSQTNIVVTGLNEKYDFELYDLTGRLIKRVTSISTNPLVLTRNDLVGGVYLYCIKVSGNSVAFGKLVAQ